MQQLAHLIRHPPQHLVPPGMAKPIVDPLEVVYVHHSHRQRLLLPGTTQPLLLQHRLSTAPIGQLRQAVHVGQLLQQGPLLGHAQGIAYPGTGDVGMEGLDDVVARPQGQALLLVLDGIQPRDDDDRNGPGQGVLLVV